MTPTRRSRLAAALLGLALLAPGGLEAQSVLARTPNLAGGWVGEPGTIHFNFLHRFDLVDGGEESIVVNTPTFLLAAPLPGDILAGTRYASNSLVAGSQQNEWELFGRWAPLSAADRAPVDLAVTAAYNEAAGSGDAELSIGLPVGPLRLLGVGRVFSDAYARGEAGWAVGAGAALRLTDGIALAADLLSASDRTDSQTLSWSAGVQLRIPLTPHTVSFQATNARTGTLQGSSVGRRDGRGDDRIFWGFEFTIPFTLSRYFGGGDGGDGPESGAAAETPGAAGTAGAEVTMTDDLRYAPSTVRVGVGETVVWRNTSRLVHTVTAEPGRALDEADVSLPAEARTFDSGNLRPGESFRHTFRTPGEYVYFCIPHEQAGMVGRVVVTR